MHCSPKDSKSTFISRINVVPKKKGFRLVIDLKHLNKRINPPSFMHETIDDLLKITNGVTWDLEQGFHHIPVHPEHSDYFCFKWKNAYYKWMVTHTFFCKTVREVVRHFRQIDLKTVSYVDNFYLCDNKENVESKTNWAVQELGKLGWHINFEKSCFNHKIECKFIGFFIQTAMDNDAVWLKLPECRIAAVIKDIKKVLKKVQVIAFASIAGQIVSMTKAVTPAKLLLRKL